MDKVEKMRHRNEIQKLGEAIGRKMGRLAKMQFTRKDGRILSDVLTSLMLLDVFLIANLKM